MKCSSASTAFKLVEKLDQKGYIKKGDGPRAIKVINKGRADKAERRAERYKNLLMDLNDDLNVVEAREQILKEALEKIVRLGLGEGLGGGYKYKEEHHAKALSIAGTALTTLYPKEEEHGSAKTNL